MRAYLPHPAGLVLDIGAGRGISSYALAFGGWQVVALEPDPSSLVGCGAIRELARETSLPIRVKEAYGEAMPFDDNTFDLVHGREVLHHARDLSKLCLEAARVLKPGGWLLVTRETVISRQEDLAIFLNNHPLHKFFGGENAFLLDRYISAITDSGLKIKKILGPLDSPINFYPFDEEAPGISTRQRLPRNIRHFIVRYLYRPRSILAHSLPRSVAYRFFRVLDTPGRLFSYIAQKPEE
jgi:SAM-dependent methyltransferase